MNQSLFSGDDVVLSKSVAVCITVVAICGSNIFDETRPTATKATLVKLAESTNSIGMKFKLIPAGTFTMGEGDEARKVTVTQPFKMGVHEVTQAQYEQVMGANPSHFKGADNPVENVNWHEAIEFCRKLSALPAEKAASNVYRLPTCADWEYAGRAGTASQFTWGDDASQLGDYAWYSSNSGTTTHPVGGKQPNAWGLYDMTGNVSEWCHDSPASGSDVLSVFRGGNWSQDADKIKHREDYRAAIVGKRAEIVGKRFGFRVALQPNQQPAKFETSSNQFRGNWTVVKWDGTKLQIERAIGGKARNTALTPSPAAWQAFWKEMDAIKVWKWEKEYIDKTIADGHSWSLNFENSGKKIVSGGSNRFPQQFNRYEKALKQLLAQERD